LAGAFPESAAQDKLAITTAKQRKVVFFMVLSFLYVPG
jgi:hypothetical protein